MAEKELTYWVHVSEYVYEIAPPDPEDDWDQGEYGMDASLLDIARSERQFWDSITYEWDAPYGVDDIAAGEIAHVVFVEYTTGSTFGREGAWGIAAIKKDPDEALKIEARCGQDDPDTNRAWDGYFECFGHAVVKSLIVQT